MDLNTKATSLPLEEQTRIFFVAALTFCLLGQLLQLSYWPGHSWGNTLTYFGLLILMPRFVAVLSTFRPVQSITILLISPLILFTCFNIIDKLYVLLPFAFAVSAKNIKFRLIVIYFFIINLSFLLMSVAASQAGLITDVVVDRDVLDVLEAETTGDNVTRHAFGYNWVTAFPAHVTYLWAMWLYLRKGVLKKWNYWLLFFSIWFVYHFCNARMETVSMSLLVICSVYYRVRVLKSEKLTVFEDILLKFPVVFFAFVMIYLTYQYRVDGGELYEILDLIISGRLRLGSDAMFDKGIPFFGQHYQQIGGEASALAYNFIDCSYLVWLIINGVFFFILAVYSLTSICNKSVKSREYLIAIIMSLLALEGSIVSIFLNFAYNPFFMALFADWDYSSSEETSS